MAKSLYKLSQLALIYGYQGPSQSGLQDYIHAAKTLIYLSKESEEFSVFGKQLKDRCAETESRKEADFLESLNYVHCPLCTGPFNNAVTTMPLDGWNDMSGLFVDGDFLRTLKELADFYEEDSDF